MHTSEQLKQLALQIVGDTARDNWEKLLIDPALQRLEDIDPAWIVPKLTQYNPYFDTRYPSSQRMLARWQAMVVRNLFFRQKPVNQQTVMEELDRIIRIRNTLQNESLFYQKNIILLSHEETDTQGNHIFGKPVVVDSLKKLAKNSTVIRPNREVSCDEQKREVLRVLEGTVPPMVFVFSGHAVGDRLYLVGDERQRQQINPTLSITAEELARTYQARLEKYPQLRSDVVREQDLYIFNTCYGHDFVRNFYTQLGRSPKPLTYTAAEYGQRGYTKTGDGYENEFFRTLLPK